MRRNLRGQVAVIVGASSGIDRATAQTVADTGSDVVLAARSAEDRDVWHRRAAAGGRCPGGPHRRHRPLQLGALLASTVENRGRIDTWVNSAALLIAGQLGAEPLEDIEDVVRADVTGPILSDRVALHHFHRQGAGVLIDVSSMLRIIHRTRSCPSMSPPGSTSPPGSPTRPMVRPPPRTATDRGTRVCTVVPGPIDTPMLQRASNNTGRALRAIPSAVAPGRAAATIVACARRLRRQATEVWTSRIVLAAHRLAPRPAGARRPLVGGLAPAARGRRPRCARRRRLLTPGGPAFEARRRELFGLLRADARQEEHDLLTSLVGAPDDRQLTATAPHGHAKRPAPNRSHPRVPIRPPGNASAGIPLALTDRLRNATAAFRKRTT